MAQSSGCDATHAGLGTGEELAGLGGGEGLLLYPAAIVQPLKAALH